MNKLNVLIRPSLVLGAILGAVFGVLLLIPFTLTLCIVFYTITLIGGGVVFYLKRNAFVGILTPQDGALIGAVSGFSSAIAGAIVYLPIEYIISLFSPLSKHINTLNSVLTTGDTLFVWPMIIFVMALMSALCNAFSGLIVAYIYEKIENNPIKDEGGIDIEQ